MKVIANPPVLAERPPAYALPIRSPGSIQVVKDLPQLMEKILALKPHDQVEMILSIENPAELTNSLEERGFLMDIRVGPESNICIKRTF